LVVWRNAKWMERRWKGGMGTVFMHVKIRVNKERRGSVSNVKIKYLPYPLEISKMRQ